LISNVGSQCMGGSRSLFSPFYCFNITFTRWASCFWWF